MAGKAGLATHVLLITLCPWVPATMAGHEVLGGIDLYGFGNQGSTCVTFWKNVAYVSGEGLSCGVHTVYSVDVSDPYDLHSIASTSLGNCKAYQSKVVDDILYVANWSAFLNVYDVSDPGHFTNHWSFNPTAAPAAWGIDVSNGRAYVAASDTACGYCDHGIWIIDVSQPHPPQPRISVIPTPSRYTGAVAVRGSYVYHSNDYNLAVANVSDELNPRIVKQVYVGDVISSIQLRDNTMYVACMGVEGTIAFHIYDISDPINPQPVGQYLGGGCNTMYLLGDYAFLAGSILTTVDVSDPTSPRWVANTNVPLASDAYGPANKSWESSATGNGQYVYVGASENYPKDQGGRPDNYTRGKLFVVDATDVLKGDPDNIGPEKYRLCSLGEASWDTSYEADALPTAASPAWNVFEGSEAPWASVSGGILRVSDTGISSNDSITWSRNWDATNTRGTTVLVRARCPSYALHGQSIGQLNNIFIEDGQFQEQFAILSDRFRASRANREVVLDGTQWHTYRITTHGSQFHVYVDENEAPTLVGALSATTNRARFMFGGGSGTAQQDIYFDYVRCFSNGVYEPPGILDDPTTTISVTVADVAGKGSLSGINPATASVHWSADGGQTWSQSGGHLWDCEYEADNPPTEALPRWSLPEGNGVITSLVSGAVHVEDNSTAWGSKVKWMRAWGARPSVGTTVLARARCTSVGGETSLLGNLYVEDGAHQERFKIMPDRIEAAESMRVYNEGFDGTQWHVYRITTKNDTFNVYLDEAAAPVISGRLTAAPSARRVMFGSGGSQATQVIDFDYIRYTSVGDFGPGESFDAGPLVVTCSGQPGDYNGVVTAYSVPLARGPEALNQVRFSMRDLIGNTGWSPLYNVRTAVPPSPDFDGDQDIDQSDFGHLQVCLTGSGVLPGEGCEGADLDEDRDVDAEDLAVLLSCMSGPNVPADPNCAD